MKDNSIFGPYKNTFKTITRDFTFNFVDIDKLPSAFNGKILSYRKSKTSSIIKCKELNQWVEIELLDGTKVTLELLKNHTNELIKHSILKYDSNSSAFREGVVSETFNLKEGGTIRSLVQSSIRKDNYFKLIINISNNKYAGNYIAMFDGSEMDDFYYTTEPENYFV